MSVRALLEGLRSLTEASAVSPESFARILAACPGIVEKFHIDLKSGRCGVNGCVFLADKERVVKIGREEREMDLAITLISTHAKLGKYRKNVPRVYYAGKLPETCTKDLPHWGGAPLFIIYRDDIEKDAHFDDVQWWNSHAFEFLESLATRLTSPGKFENELRAFIADETEARKPSTGDIWRLRQAAGLIRELAKNNVYLCDMHAANWGERGGVLVARDTGCIRRK